VLCGLVSYGQAGPVVARQSRRVLVGRVKVR